MRKISDKKIEERKNRLWRYNNLILSEIVPQCELATEECRETPGRSANAMLELLKGYQPPDFKFTTFPTNYKGMLVRAPIPFTSVCAHHVLPYTGHAYVGIIYNKKKLGISKIIRAVQYWAARLTSQEELTQFMVEQFDKIIKPKGVIVVLKAFHLCEGIRGVKVPNVETTTSWYVGVFEKDSTRNEFYSLIGGKQ